MYHKDSPATIQSMFNSIANRYDFANSVLSFSLHKYWNRALIRHVRQTASQHILLDLCSGTGDIAFDYLKNNQSSCHAYLIDFSSEMLEHAKRKEKKINVNSSHRISYIEADVQYLPLENEIAHCATMAYGIRNVQDPNLCFKEVLRVLKPGGCFGILELTRPSSPLLRLGHQFYLSTLIPFLGKWLTDNQQAYEYLFKSIQTFTPPEELQKLLIENGFHDTQRIPLIGGVATIIMGYKGE
ncbi:MAG: bifunctional demethylmenaquinone methyltransferase/2-methoxy-6-polyprenyl-1,4-benzoquinol methylase UbiE [Parachlamydiaceae bacterium]